MRIKWFIFFVFISALSFFSCQVSTVLTKYQPPNTAPYYTSAFPYVDVSDQLEEINQSLVKITSSSIYKRYFFEEENISKNKLDTVGFREKAHIIDGFTKEKTGTAIIIARNGNTLFLLTAGTFFSYPDTLIQYANKKKSMSEKMVKYLSIKVNQFNVALYGPYLSGFEVLAKDGDLALLKITVEKGEDVNVKQLNINLGNSEKLRLGSFVYVLGYPNGQPITERGIISNLNQPAEGDFYTDALFNDGIEGGLIIATKDNFQTFQWVGMVHSSGAKQDSFLIPDNNQNNSYKNGQAYFGPYRIKKNLNVIYGVTKAISTVTISNFLIQYKQMLVSNTDSLNYLNKKHHPTLTNKR